MFYAPSRFLKFMIALLGVGAQVYGSIPHGNSPE
jgi:hypothetical protein